jgi:gliding motility-associated-like protein
MLQFNRYIIVLFLILSNINAALAQVSITSSHSAISMAQMLAGPGVSISNAFYNGACDSSTQSGKFFVTSPSLLGLDSGILLTSGLASNAIGASATPSLSNGAAGDPDLFLLCGPQTSNDACVLEFDFVPIGDTIKFKYVFGSSEYNSFSCSIADVFGFFISGPGIVGSFSNSSANLALLPNGCYVGVNTVNGQTTNPCGNAGAACSPPNNALFYSNLPLGNTTTGIAYNGYTLPLYATTPVVACSTYHLKLAISDASDFILDSGVFLEAGSLSSNTPILSFSTGLGVNTPVVVEGCDSLVIKIKRNTSCALLVVPDTINLILGGVAQMGPDYSPIPTTVYFTSSVADSVKTLVIYPYQDFINEANEYITLQLFKASTGVTSDTTFILIKDSLSFTLDNIDTIICSGQSVQTNGVGYSGQTFSWTPTAGVANPNSLNTIITPVSGITTYSVTGNYLGCPSMSKSFKITVDNTPNLILSNDTTYCRPGVPVLIRSNANYSYTWSPTTNLSCSNCPFPIANPTVSQNYVATTTTASGCVYKDTLRITIIPLLLNINTNKDSICLGQSIQFTPPMVSGSSATWVLNMGNGTNFTNAIPTPNPYTYTTANNYELVLIAQDNLGCKDTFTKNINVDGQNYCDFSIVNDKLCIGTAVSITDTISPSAKSWTYSFDGYEINNVRNPVYTFPGIGSALLITLTSKNPKCLDYVVSKSITINDYPLLNLGPDLKFCENFGTAINLTNQSTSGGSYIWQDGSVNSSFAVSEPGSYYATLTDKGCTSTDSVNVWRDCYLDIPNAFTPGADGSNQYFIPTNTLSSGLTSFSMNIFNRWGELVFATSRIDSRGWDGQFGGKPQPMGTYVYQINAVFKNAERKSWTGNITLIR